MKIKKAKEIVREKYCPGCGSQSCY